MVEQPQCGSHRIEWKQHPNIQTLMMFVMSRNLTRNRVILPLGLAHQHTHCQEAMQIYGSYISTAKGCVSVMCTQKRRFHTIVDHAIHAIIFYGMCLHLVSLTSLKNRTKRRNRSQFFLICIPLGEKKTNDYFHSGGINAWSLKSHLHRNRRAILALLSILVNGAIDW